jgi:hypothetical protein
LLKLAPRAAPLPNARAFSGGRSYIAGRASRPTKEATMAKGQKRSNRETRKPKADKGPKTNASQPSVKPTGLGTVEKIKTR